MGKTTLIVRIDEETKEEARQLASEVGLTLSNLVNIQLKQVVRSRQIKIEAPKREESGSNPNLANDKAVQKAAKSLRSVKQALTNTAQDEGED